MQNLRGARLGRSDGTIQPSREAIGGSISSACWPSKAGSSGDPPDPPAGDCAEYLDEAVDSVIGPGPGSRSSPMYRFRAACMMPTSSTGCTDLPPAALLPSAVERTAAVASR